MCIYLTVWTRSEVYQAMAEAAQAEGGYEDDGEESEKVRLLSSALLLSNLIRGIGTWSGAAEVCRRRCTER